MIEKLLLIAALLAPAVAYGANPRTESSVQVPVGINAGGGGSTGGGDTTGSTSGGSTSGGSTSGGSISGGGGGVGGSPTAPAQALSGCSSANGGSSSNGSCFSTLALNLDWTGATSSTAQNNPSFDARTFSNWLDCAGASKVVLRNSDNQNNAIPCSDYSLVTDVNGDTALQMVFTVADWNSGSGNGSNVSYNDLDSTLQGGGTAFYPGVTGTFPQEYYVEARLAMGSASDNSCGANGSVQCFGGSFWLWGASGSGGSYQEEDVIEYYLPQSRNWVLANSSHLGTFDYLMNAVGSSQGINSSQYNVIHTVGIRKTVANDGSNNSIVCSYIDNVQRVCDTVNNVDEKTRMGINLWSGPGVSSPVETYTGTNTMVFEWIRFWTCGNWWQNNGSYTDGSACEGVVLGSGQ